MPNTTTDLVAALLQAVREPTDDHLTALRSVLDDGFHGAGLFVSSSDPDALIEALRTPPVPVLAMASWRDPEASPDGGVTIRGDLPPGLPISAVTLLVRERDGRIAELLQEIVPADPPPEIGVHLDDAVVAFVSTAFDRQAPLVVAYVDEQGSPRVSYRGTLQVLGADALAMWVRDRQGGLLRAIATNPKVAVIGSDHASRAHYTFAGRARVDDDPEVRRRVFDASPAHERDVDPAMRGVAVVIDVDEVRGGALGSAIHQRRS